MQYRISYRINGSVSESLQYYNVYHSSEALDSLLHTWRKGHIHGKILRILAVEEYNRFGAKWVDRTQEALAHCEAPELSKDDATITLKPIPPQ